MSDNESKFSTTHFADLTFLKDLPSDEVDALKNIILSSDIEPHERDDVVQCLLDSDSRYEEYKSWRTLYDSQRVQSLKDKLADIVPVTLRLPCEKLLGESKFKSIKVILEAHSVHKDVLKVLSELEQLVDSLVSGNGGNEREREKQKTIRCQADYECEMNSVGRGSECESELLSDSDGDCSSNASIMDGGDLNVVTEQLKGFPDEMNVLLLGETGAGKSTAINALANYLKFVNIDEAVDQPTVLIRSSFTFTDLRSKVSSRRIRAEPTVDIEDFEEGESSNEDLRAGESSTQRPKSYLFSWNSGEKNKLLRIIDTPGIGDVRGIEFDRKNIEMILDLIRHVPKLHGICILIRPNAPRLTAELRFSIDELLVHLDKSAAQNIMICLTGTRHTFYGPGETFATLSEHFKKIETDFNCVVPLNKDNLFCFDNEGFRYICGVKSGYAFPKGQRQFYSESYTHSAVEAWRMFSEIGSLQAHFVSNTLALNNARRYMRILSADIARTSKDLKLHRELLAEKNKRIAELQNEEDDLKKRLYSKRNVIVRVPTTYPKTVCTNETCIEHKKFHPNSPMEPYYKTVCDANCPLTNVQRESYPNTALQQCTAMGPDLKCRICGCSWQTHMHIYYDLVKQMKDVENSDVKEHLKEKEQELVVMNEAVTKLKEMVTDLTDMLDSARSDCSQLARFVKDNCIIPYNSSYIQYLDYLFSQEKSKVAVTNNYAKMRELERLKAEYQEQISIFNQSDLDSKELMNANEIVEFVEKLSKDYKVEQKEEQVQEVPELLVLQDEAELKSIVISMGNVEF